MIRIVLLTMDGDVTSERLVIVKTLNKMAIVLPSPYITSWTLKKSISRSWKAPRNDDQIKNSSEIKQNGFN